MPIFIKNPDAYSTGFVSAQPGRYALRLKPGTYSVLMVGGGGGGSGNNGSSTWHPTTASGGGSGYAIKARLVVTQNTTYTVVVGAGGAKNSLGFPSQILNEAGENVLVADGGQPGRYIAAGLRAQGGDGGSGGGSGGGTVIYNNTDYRWSVPGDGGANGTDGGGNAAVSGGVSAGPGGKGEGAGYYDAVLTSMDAHILHGFTLGTHGLGGTRRHGNGTSGMRGSCGGGGGGMGNFVEGIHQYSGTGYGAGGTTGNTNAQAAGNGGFVSILNLDGSDPVVSNNRWAKINQPYYKLAADRWVPAKKVSYKIQATTNDYIGKLTVGSGTATLGGWIGHATGWAPTGLGALHTTFGKYVVESKPPFLNILHSLYWIDQGNGRYTLVAHAATHSNYSSLLIAIDGYGIWNLSITPGAGSLVADCFSAEVANFPSFPNNTTITARILDPLTGTVAETLPDGNRVIREWKEVWPQQITYIHTGYAESLNMHERFGRPTTPAHYVFINNGQIGSLENNFALRTGVFPAGSVLTFINNGVVSGRGGNGAYATDTNNQASSNRYPTVGTPGLLLEFPTQIALNSGSVLQGGGGGGGGGREKSNTTYTRYGGGGAGLPAGLPSGGVAGRTCYPNTGGTITPLPGTLAAGGRHSGPGSTSSFGGDPGQPGRIQGWGNSNMTSKLHLGTFNPAIINSGLITSISGNNANTLKGGMRPGNNGTWLFATAKGETKRFGNWNMGSVTYRLTHTITFTGSGTIVGASMIYPTSGVTISRSGKVVTIVFNNTSRSDTNTPARFNVTFRSPSGQDTVVEFHTST